MTSGTDQPLDNVADLLRQAAARFPARQALISLDGTRTWAELDRAVDSGVAALAGTGLQPGDRVIVSLPTGEDIVAALFAAARAGLIAVPIGPSRAELDEIAAKVGARAVITGRTQTSPEIRVSPADLKGWWSGSPAAGGSSGVGGGEDIAVLARAASSPRPVMVSHRAILAAVAAIGQAPRLGLRTDDRAIQVLPTYHLAGWVTSLLPLALVGAAAVIPQDPSNEVTWLDSVLTAIRSQRVTIVPGAPSLYRRLRTAPGAERALASVRLMTSGAAPLDPGDSSAIRGLTGQPVWEGYGISESASVISTSLMTTASRTGSVGSPLPGVQLRIVGDDNTDLYADDDEQGTADDQADIAAGAGAIGEVGGIQIGGPTLFSGYWPDGAGGASEDGWFSTGDLGYFDDIGELHLVDRAAETIRVAGFTVYPREIEDVLSRHPYVRDAAVISAPGRAGDAVVAVIVPMRGTHPTRDDLDDFVADRMPVFKRPQQYRLVDRLPRNEIGRVDREAVRVLYQSAASKDLLLEPDLEPEVDSAEVAAQVFDESAGAPDEPLPAEGAPEPAPERDVTPEPAAPLEELGSRLPGTGRRDGRSDQDTDDDLF